MIVLLFIRTVFIVTYRIWFHPLAKFPGPKLAAVSRLYEFWYQGIKRTEFPGKIKEMHKVYGLSVERPKRTPLMSNQGLLFVSAPLSSVSMTRISISSIFSRIESWKRIPGTTVLASPSLYLLFWTKRSIVNARHTSPHISPEQASPMPILSFSERCSPYVALSRRAPGVAKRSMSPSLTAQCPTRS